MANYTTGTLTITEGLTTVVGDGTAFLTNVKAGQFLTIAGLCKPYQICAVTDDVTLQLTQPIQIIGDPTSGFILSEQTYAVLDSFTSNISIPFFTRDDINKQPKLVRIVNTIDQNMAVVLGWQHLRDEGELAS